MPALQPKDIWDQTGRYDKVNVLFKLSGQGDRDLVLGPTHEEVVTPLLANFIRSYRDLPVAAYQIQTKFRNEARAKSGLLRGREFRMKDMYSFHTTQESLDEFYQETIKAYQNIYRRCGLGDITLLTYASGGVFSKFSHEFQTITPYGEDIIYRVPNTDIAINKEIIDDESVLANLVPDYKAGDTHNLDEIKAIEVGNIFKLGSRFSDAFSASYADSGGQSNPILMGCYGLGPSRIMGTIAECLSDERGLVWPTEIAPFHVHLVALVREDVDIEKCNDIYRELLHRGIDVLYDDRAGVQAVEKMADADLMGMPFRIVVSKKTLSENKLELKERTGTESIMLSLEGVIAEILLSSAFKPTSTR